MKETEQNIPHELLAKYFAGETTTAEQETVRVWKSNNPDLFDQYFILWQDTGILKSAGDLPAFETEKAWKKFQKNNIKITGRDSMWDQFWKVAAVMLFIISTVLWLIPRKTESVILTAVAVENDLTTVRLSDGSTVTLNQNSTLTYAGDFGAASRSTILTGEAFFNVAPDAQRPFTVQAGETIVTVLGTSFNVKVEASGLVEVAVLTGKVGFEAAGQFVELPAGQTGLFLLENQEIKQKQADVTGISTFWKNKKLTFEGQHLSEVIAIINQAYQVNIELESPAISTCQLRVVFENSTIDEVLAVIALTLELEVRKEIENYYLSGKGCEAN